MADFAMHAVSVGPGILAISSMPGRDGGYEEAMSLLHDWQPALVLSMTTEAEMVAHGAAGLGADVQDMGTRWFHVPVPDFGAPDTDIEELWHVASKAALAALSGGGRVLIHCNGGCGRSGMAALRLMVEAGETPVAALARLRAVRPCAVETPAQLSWASAG